MEPLEKDMEDSSKTMPSLNKKYSIILCDAPWTYRDKALAGNRGAGCKYDLMTETELMALPIKDLAAENCVLFFWVTMPKLFDAEQIIKAWGFEYKTCAFTWIKKNKIADSLFWGMGRWTRSNPELCLLVTRGSPSRVSAAVHSVVMTPIERHSKKPDEVRKRIIQLCGDLPRIELFAREKTEGWDSWGNEINSDIIL